MNDNVEASIPLAEIAVIGEVLWDIVGQTRRLGGAPLNFAANAAILGHPVRLITALGTDALGDEAAAEIAAHALDMSCVQRTPSAPTGTAIVVQGADGEPVFQIARPAAWDCVELDDRTLTDIVRSRPGWIYFGTLFASAKQGYMQLFRLLDVLDSSRRFVDLNLRPGSNQPGLVEEILRVADVVKLNEDEQAEVAGLFGLPEDIEAFCRAAMKQFGLHALGVTRGSRGCALLVGDDYCEAPAPVVDVADTVGAGDAFAAAFVHGMSLSWSAADIAAFANRLAARVASRHGSLPELGVAASADDAERTGPAKR